MEAEFKSGSILQEDISVPNEVVEACLPILEQLGFEARIGDVLDNTGSGGKAWKIVGMDKPRPLFPGSEIVFVDINLVNIADPLDKSKVTAQFLAACIEDGTIILKKKVNN